MEKESFDCDWDGGDCYMKFLKIFNFTEKMNK